MRGVGGQLQEVVVPALGGVVEHLVQHGLGLHVEVLGRAAAHLDHAVLLRVADDGRGLDHVQNGIKGHRLVEQVGQNQGHADRRIARGRGVDGYLVLCRGHEQRFLGMRSILSHGFADLVMQHSRGEGLGIVDPLDRPQDGFVGGFQGVLLADEDVVDAGYAVVAQGVVVHLVMTLHHGEVVGPMQVVVEVGSGGDDQVDEAGLDQRDDRAAHADGGHGSGQGQGDGGLVVDHSREEPGPLSQAPGVEAAPAVDVVDEVRDVLVARKRKRFD